MPRPFPSMSGNFDDPLASEHLHETADRIVRDILDNSQASNAEISPSGELYRAIERFHRTRAAAAARSQNENNVDQMASDQEPGRRRRQRESSETSPLFVLSPQPSGPPLSARERAAARLALMNARRGRARLMSNVERLQERNRVVAAEDAGNGLADLHNAGRQLEAASSTLRALLDDPVPSLMSPDLEAEDYSSEAAYNHRAKRRKLDFDKADSGLGFRYGKYGQVEPGKLKMEIVSCDGGIYQQQGGDYSAENVLSTDATVYCTKSNRCNLVLRHQGSTVFSLTELIIKAPHSGYTAPVQEGMVFISMTSDDLLTRTALYQIQYSPPPPRRSRSPLSSERPPIMSIRHNGDGTLSTAQARTRRLYEIGLQDDECEFRTAQIPLDFTANAPPFNVTTECSDSENEDETRINFHTRRAHRMLNLPNEDSESSGEEDDTGWRDDYLLGGMGHSPRYRRRETASNITLAEAAEASQVATQEAVRAVGGELMAPHARFFIERDKSKCTVRFDPPVSGRFILLKMWSPNHQPSGNIDIQSVVAKGFAGPRFFPALDMR